MNRIKGTVLIAAGVLAGMLISGPAGTALAALTANPSSQTFYLDGQRVDFQAYEINGSNYVKLRDIGQAVDFGVTYDAATNSVHISPDSPYAEEVNTPRAEPGVGDGYLTNGKPITEENVLEMLRQIEQDWPTGTIWGTRNTLETHKNEIPSTEARNAIDGYQVNSTYGCGGYAAMINTLIFGDKANPGHRLEDISKLRPGDIVFVVNPDGETRHVVVALESPNEEGRFHYTDGNHGEIITWPNPEHFDLRSYSLTGFSNGYHLEVWTRYPDSISYTGNSVNAWPAGTP